MLLEKQIPRAFVETSAMLNSSLFLLNWIIGYIQATSARAYGLSEGKLYLLEIFTGHITFKIKIIIHFGTMLNHTLNKPGHAQCS